MKRRHVLRRPTLAGDGAETNEREDVHVQRMTRIGRGRSRWLTVASVAIVALTAVALTAAAQPTPPAAPQPGAVVGTAPCPGMGPGAAKAAKCGLGHGEGKGMPCGMGHGEGKDMACGMGQGAGMGMDCCKGPGGMPGRHRVAGRMQDCTQHLLMAAEKIGLTEAQKTQLHELRRRGPATIMPKTQALMEARMDFQDLMMKKDAATADIRKAHEKLLKAQSDLRAAAFDLRLQAREVLTPEQREKLHEEMRPMMMGHGDGPGPMGMFLPDDGPEDGDDEGAEF
jgi:Spy/CpxP family protein refolding chaperone